MSYDGTEFNGWQCQKENMRTVQEALEEAIFNVFGKKIDVHGSGRTDSGVHAIGQVIHFDIDKTKEEVKSMKIDRAINYYLPDDVRIMKYSIVSKSFHARKSAKAKEYIYRIANTSALDPIYRNICYKISSEIAIDKMIKASKILEGEHDFKAFSNKNNQGIAVYDSVRTIFYIKIKKVKGIITIRVKGSGFLYKMVRNIVGTLVYIAWNKLDESCIIKSFSDNKRCSIGPAFSPKGLCLHKVFY